MGASHIQRPLWLAHMRRDGAFTAPRPAAPAAEGGCAFHPDVPPASMNQSNGNQWQSMAIGHWPALPPASGCGANPVTQCTFQWRPALTIVPTPDQAPSLPRRSQADRFLVAAEGVRPVPSSQQSMPLLRCFPPASWAGCSCCSAALGPRPALPPPPFPPLGCRTAATFLCRYAHERVPTWPDAAAAAAAGRGAARQPLQPHHHCRGPVLCILVEFFLWCAAPCRAMLRAVPKRARGMYTSPVRPEI